MYSLLCKASFNSDLSCLGAVVFQQDLFLGAQSVKNTVECSRESDRPQSFSLWMWITCRSLSGF